MRRLIALGCFVAIVAGAAWAPSAQGKPGAADALTNSSASAPGLQRTRELFDEPLVAQRPAREQEQQRFQAAVVRFQAQGDPHRLNDLEQYLSENPDSPYRAALLTNLGLRYYHGGYFSKAMLTWQRAWDERQSASGTPAKPLVDRAIGELIRLHARVGHAERVAALLEEVKGWPVSGRATEIITNAQEGLWVMRSQPGIAFLCGPMALRSILETLAPEDAVKRALVEAYRSGPQGVSLGEVAALSSQLGLDWLPVKRLNPGDIPVPSVVHWKINHYAAIVGFDGQRYHLKDPTFGEDLWVKKEAIESESDGFYLMPAAHMSPAWRVASAEEQREVHGMGFAQLSNGNATRGTDKKAKTCQDDTGCAAYNAHSMVVSLNISDTPVGYRPAAGPDMHFTLTYNQRESSQPELKNFSNLGPKWTHNWLAYVEDDPAAIGSNKTLRIVAGGGAQTQAKFNSSTGRFAPETDSGAVLSVTSLAPIVYTLTQPDGSQLVFAASNGGTTTRRVFLSQLIDPQGNAVSLEYDTAMRLTTVRDAFQRATTLSYNWPGQPNLISAVSDPAGRSAGIEYAAGADGIFRLLRITDAVKMQSSFEYGNAGTPDFITAMTTPYGTSRFAYGDDIAAGGTRRWLELKDARGFTERVEFRQGFYSDGTTPILPPNVDPAQVPSAPGLVIWANDNNYRNSFYWDQYNYANYNPQATDYTLAHVDHWLTQAGIDINTTASTLQSSKAPNEYPVWYTYPGQKRAGFSGTFDQPAAVARVVPMADGSTQSQVSWREYNAQGNVTRVQDPAGRETCYAYAANGVDLLTVSQRTSGTAGSCSNPGLTVLATYGDYVQHLPGFHTDAAGQTTVFKYTPYGQIKSVTNPRQEVTTYTYDSQSHYLRSIINANGLTQATFGRDAAGNVTSITDSEGHKVRHQYDGLDRLTLSTYPDKSTERYDWDRLDLGLYTNRLGFKTKYHHTATRQLDYVTEEISASASRTTNLAYYPNGRLYSLEDGNKNLTVWNRDTRAE